MNIQKYCKDELKVTGKSVGCFFNDKHNLLNSPLTPRENFLRFLNREECAWIPRIDFDAYNLYPEQVPDNNVVTIQVGEVGIASLGEKLVKTPLHPELAPMPDTNNYLIKDIEEWTKIQWPDVDSWDWKGAEEEYKNIDRENRLVIACMQHGLNQRLGQIMGFTNGLTALLEDPDNVHAFNERLIQYNLDVIDHYAEYLKPDVIFLCEDWGTQKAPFFSSQVADEFMVPHVKKLAEHTHELGMKFMLHSCGNITSMVSQMIDAGVDDWQFNYEACAASILETIHRYGEQILFDGYFGMSKPLPAGTEELKNFVLEKYASFCDTARCSLTFYGASPEVQDNPNSISSNKNTGEAWNMNIPFDHFVYETARKTADQVYKRA